MSDKYPRTPHLPWSPGGTSDDKVLTSVDHFLNVPVVITEKMDGSNLCITRHAVYARSHNGPPTHASFDLAKALHANVRHSIPDGLSVFGEYVFAVHSIRYERLPGYFLVFGVREDATGKWWSWEMVCEMAREINCPTVPVLGPTANRPLMFAYPTQMEDITSFLGKEPSEHGVREGVVVRIAGEFVDFPKSVAKWVRANHVTTDQHWTQKEIERNKLANE